MKYIGAFFLSLIITGITFAQTEGPDSTTSKGFGIRFLFDGFRLSGGIGAKLWLSETSAMALNLTGRTESNTYSEYSDVDQSINLGLDYEKHFTIYKNLTVFGLASPNVGFGRNKFTSDTYSYDHRYWTLGVGLGWGAEYWVAHNLSFSASQSINYRYLFYIDENRNYYSGYIATSSLMISLYF